MKRVVTLLIGLLVVIAAYKVYAYRRDTAELERLGRLFDPELAEFLSLTWPRRPLPGEPVEGFALDWYSQAAKLGEGIDDELNEAGAGFGGEVQVEIEAAVDAWLDEGGILSEALPGAAVSRLEAWAPALEQAEKGTRTPAVGPRTSVKAAMGDGPGVVWAVTAMKEMLLLAAAVESAAGNDDQAARRALCVIRMGDDVARAGTLIEEMVGAVVRELGGRVLERLLADGRLAEETLEIAATALEDGLRDRLPDSLAARGEWFAIQHFFRIMARDDDAEEWLGIPPPSSRVEQIGEWFGGGVSKGEIAAAWKKIREIRARLDAAADEEAYHAELISDHGWSDSTDTRWFARFAQPALANPTLYTKWREARRGDEALVLACRALLHLRRTGSLPESLESFRSAEVRESPEGGAWRLVPADDSKPARLQLVVAAAAVHEVVIR